jgi:hypothetical protein
MREFVHKKMFALVHEFDEFAVGLPEEAFVASIPGRSNTVGEQLWCVIGGRESGVRAIENSKWMGFGSSLKETAVKSEVVDTLKRSGEAFANAYTGEASTAVHDRVGLFVLEHDAMHQGQLIRFAYALNLPFPKSWVDHWELT